MSGLSKRNVKGSNCNELLPNEDGSLNVKAEIVDAGSLIPKETISVYSEAPVVASGATQTIATYIVPLTKILFLQLVEFGGENIATYSVLVDSVVIARKRTWFNGDLSDEFDFEGYGNAGLRLEAGQTVELQVENFRPDAADFEGRIFGTLQG